MSRAAAEIDPVSRIDASSRALPGPIRAPDLEDDADFDPRHRRGLYTASLRYSNRQGIGEATGTLAVSDYRYEQMTACASGWTSVTRVQEMGVAWRQWGGFFVA